MLKSINYYQYFETQDWAKSKIHSFQRLLMLLEIYSVFGSKRMKKMTWAQLVYRLGVNTEEWVIHIAKWKKITKLHAYIIAM